jgi:phosphopantothenate-cysteine ligase
MKTVLITAGGTVEAIDGVRGITNFSSGKLGAIIAETLTNSKVFLIKGSKSVMPKNISANMTIIETTDTKSVQEAIESVMNNNHIDYFIQAMAISDYTVDKVVSVEELINSIDEYSTYSKNDIINLLKNPPAITNRNKVSSTITQPLIYLKQTPKIIATIKQKWPHVKLIGFKLLNNVSKEELINVAMASLKKNNAEYIVANDLTEISNSSHKAYIVNNNGILLETATKEDLAISLKSIIENDDVK